MFHVEHYGNIKMIDSKKFTQKFLIELNIYAEELIKWNKQTDLIGISTQDDIFQRHFFNSLQLLPYLKKTDKIIIDVGTGAGFPAMVCAAYDKSRHYIMYEKKYQKRVFLKHIAGRLNIQNIDICDSFDIKNCPVADVLTSRALLNMKDIIILKSSIKRIILFKGRNFQQEIKDLLVKEEHNNIHYYHGYNDDSFFTLR